MTDDCCPRPDPCCPRPDPCCPRPRPCCPPPCPGPSKKINPFLKRSMLKGLLAFLVGLYTGMYICQSYDIPCVDPQSLYEEAKEFADRCRKPKDKK